MSEFLATDRLDGEAPTIEGRLADIIEMDGGAVVQISEYKLSDSDRALVVKALRAAAARCEVQTNGLRPEALQALKNYIQADADGVMVYVSRQALDEAIAALGAAQASPVPTKPEPTRWPAKGDRMKFLGVNGYPFELEQAKKIFTVGQSYRVHACNVESWSHSVQFDGIKGWFNGVMFERTSEVPSAERT